MCDRWKHFANFIADMGPKPKGYSLDRINNDGNYEPKNCRWTTTLEQNNNARSNVVFTLNGETKTASQWSKILGVSAITLRARSKRGWSDERALREAIHVQHRWR